MNERQIMERADRFIREKFRRQARAQGHFLTGALENSIVGTITITKTEAVLECTPLTYAWYVDRGVTPNRIPYGSGSGGGGGTSKYIQGLISYFKLRGLDEKEAKRAAFATANKHKKEGMSTDASKRFSSTGKRNHFIEEVKDVIESGVDKIVLDGYDEAINQLFTKTGNEDL